MGVLQFILSIVNNSGIWYIVHDTIRTGLRLLYNVLLQNSDVREFCLVK